MAANRTRHVLQHCVADAVDVDYENDDANYDVAENDVAKLMKMMQMMEIDNVAADLTLMSNVDEDDENDDYDDDGCLDDR